MVIVKGERVCLPRMQKSQFLGLNLMPSSRRRSFQGWKSRLWMVIPLARSLTSCCFLFLDDLDGELAGEGSGGGVELAEGAVKLEVVTEGGPEVEE